MVYVDRPRLVTLSTESSASKDNKLLRRAYGPYRILQSTEHTVTVHENDIANITLIHHTTALVETVENPRRSQASITSSKDNQTLFKTDSYT